MIIFGDEGIPPAACRMLAAFEQKHRVLHLSDEFSTGTADTDWLTALAERKEQYVILTRDAAILRRSNERASLLNTGSHLVILASQFHRLRRDELLIEMIRGWRGLIDQIERLQHPTVLRWYHRGNKRIEIVGRLTLPLK